MSVRCVPLGEVVLEANPGFASGERSASGILQVRMNCVTPDGELNLQVAPRVPAPPNISRYLLEPDDVLFNSTNSPELVGKCARFDGHTEPVTFSNHFLRLRTNRDRLEPTYLARWIGHQWKRRVFEGMCTQWVNQASVHAERLLQLQIPLPRPAEQRRIAALLDKADAVRRKRRESLLLLDDFLHSAFLEMFGDPVRNERGWEVAHLDDVARVVSGVTKGRDLRGRDTVHVPYLRVANVQDGRIDLQQVKSIEATAEEIAQYRLVVGDILLTEGGDPDKLGRGAVWLGEIGECIHQNHVFRVRLTHRTLLPEYLSALLGSVYGKRYFLKAAKQTTGIASINRRQLGAFPVLLAPNDSQSRYAAMVKAVRRTVVTLQLACTSAERLFNALAHRAFATR